MFSVKRMSKKILSFLVIGLFWQLSTVCLSAANTAIEPVPRDEKWIERHEGFVAQAKKGGIDLLFLGDSITDYWRIRGKSVWDKYYAPRRAANFGIGGDRTQHLLWRLQNGELDGIHPSVVVLLIGVNNTPIEKNGKPRNTVPEIVEGIETVVKEIQTRLPKSKILLLGVFPYKQKEDPMRATVKQINTGIAHLGERPGIQFLDIGHHFLEPDGTLSKDIMPDLLHPNEKGYEIWAEAMEPVLSKMLE